MKHILRILTIALAASTLCGCLERQFSQGEPELILSKMEVFAPSDIKGSRNMVKTEIVVTSNMSWMAELEEDTPWLTVPDVSYKNLSGMMMSSTLSLFFTDNESSSDRVATLVIRDERGGCRKIPVRQSAISRYCELDCNPYDLMSLRAEGGTVTVPFITNTEWHVSVKEGATLQYELQSGTEGCYSGDITLFLKPNEGSTSRQAVFVLSALGCKDIEIPICQVGK